jgi:hypothetical protein
LTLIAVMWTKLTSAGAEPHHLSAKALELAFAQLGNVQMALNEVGGVVVELCVGAPSVRSAATIPARRSVQATFSSRQPRNGQPILRPESSAKVSAGDATGGSDEAVRFKSRQQT